jgi:hypothetical protein
MVSHLKRGADLMIHLVAYGRVRPGRHTRATTCAARQLAGDLGELDENAFAE